MKNTVGERMLSWYDEKKRVLPFRGTHDPYLIWVSEIMLQQTRTETVSGYFTRFVTRFPDVFSLASAPEEDVLKLWEGLGYYSRARNLHKTAKRIVSEYGGVFPADVNALRALPGVGDYTAAAVASIAFDLPAPAMDGNLTRVMSRLHGIREDTGAPSVKRLLLEKAKQDMPEKRCGDFNQALMDLGATVCLPGTPDCENCPLRGLCDACAAGDADLLPIKSAAKPPKEIRLAVAIVTCGGRALMMKRREALLKDLWVFPLLEDAGNKSQVEKVLRQMGVRAQVQEKLGEARHVFTHRVWLMTLYHCAAERAESREGEWLTLRQMEERPLPTAMRAAKAEAKKLLSLSIEPIAEENIASVSAAYAESWQSSHSRHCTPAFLQEHTPLHMEMILRGHRDAGKDIFCLKKNEETAGVLVLDQKKNELVSLYLKPAFQGMGLGRQAVEFAISRLDQHRDMRVTVLMDNERALHLYRSCGFTVVKKERLLNKDRQLFEAELIRPTKAEAKSCDEFPFSV